MKLKIKLLNRAMFFAILLTGQAVAQITPDSNNILYVDQNVSGGDGSGDSWSNANPELRYGLAWADEEWDGSDAPLQIWVADGLYLPSYDDADRNATFQLVDNVEL